MPEKFTAEEFFEWIVKKTIWFYLPFYAIWRLGKELIKEIFANEQK
jgi:hypothetical protein